MRVPRIHNYFLFYRLKTETGLRQLPAFFNDQFRLRSGGQRIQNKGLSVGMLREILLRAPEEKRNGKLLVKLNPYITDRQKEEYGIKTVSGNLLDDGLLLWNNTNDEWENIFASRFSMIRYTEIYYEEYEQSNRMYLLTKQ